MKTKEMGVAEFVECLNGFADQDFPVREVHRFLQETPVIGEELENYFFWAEDRYTRNLVHKSDNYEILVICWGPGQSAPIHGHEGEKCWARVERGKLRITNYAELPRGDSFELKLLSNQDGEAGFLDGPADIHAVENPFSEPAVSLHVYSRPYAECDIYDVERGIKTRQKLAYDTRFGRMQSRQRQ